MKISLKWLQNYFDEPLPSAEAINDALTFHAFEVEESSGDYLDVKVLPNRAADCLSHRGLAKELAAILNLPLKMDPLREPTPSLPHTDKLSVNIEDKEKCLRYMGALVKGVKIGSSPQWLRESLEAVGQRSINNVVDATNYVMLNIGQPLHAFDADKLVEKEGSYRIGVRNAKEGETITTLSNETFTLTPAILLITDANADVPIGIAGVKGGKVAEVSAGTTNLVIEAANFDGTLTRRAAQALKLFTDASLRFQNRPSPELVAYGMQDVLKLIVQIVGGEVVGVVDVYPKPQEQHSTTVSVEKINQILGSQLTGAEVGGVFSRLQLPYKEEGGVFEVIVPFERIDLTIPEDLAEEVGRVIGYDRLEATELPAVPKAPNQDRYRGIERMKDQLVEQGYTEVSTQSFAPKGDITLANPLDKARPALRRSLEENLKEALTRAKYNAPLVLTPGQTPKLFEVGSVFPKEGEFLELRMTEKVVAWGDAAGVSDNLTVAKLEDYGKDYVPKQYTLGAYKPFSVYPFIARDIALWVPGATEPTTIEKLLREHAGDLLVRLDQFDRFEKEGRTSLAFRLIFQSLERTLTEVEVNEIMEKIYTVLRTEGMEIR